MRKLLALLILISLALAAAIWISTRPTVIPDPEIYTAEDDDPMRIACSARATGADWVWQPATGETVLESFSLSKGWGAAENLTLVPDPFGNKPVLKVRYSAGATSPSQQETPISGAAFHAPQLRGKGVTRACLTYQVLFPDDFDFVRGGKLPGLSGGKRPSGGARPTGDDGFSMRLMWRKTGDGELYGYFPNMQPDSNRGGDQIGTGAWQFRRGAWTRIDLELVLNDPKRSNGEARLWIDGAPAIFLRNILYRQTGAVTIDALSFSTFFGGQADRFAPETDQRAYFKDFAIHR